nr:MAG TPA: hypothetical protein [Caudoviricetes sp.]
MPFITSLIAELRVSGSTVYSKLANSILSSLDGIYVPFVYDSSVILTGPIILKEHSYGLSLILLPYCIFCITIDPFESIVVYAVVKSLFVCIFPAQILTSPFFTTLPFKSDLLSIDLLDVIPATMASLSIITTSSEDNSLTYS